ncbi:MAG: aminopeptidase [Bacteroidales bacterium]|jgi:aminopeptidase C|nr:aminopeptidase [Bacteroidales bacterium]
MKKSSLLLVAIALLACNVSFAQDKEKSEEEGYIFKITKELPVTSVKDQNRAGTCWCYSGLAFIESELLRMGKGEYDLSEMYIVSNTYNDRAKAAVRMHGDVSFSQGGSFYDVIYGMKTFGLVPESEMRPGAAYGDTLSDHGELSDVTNAIVDAIAKKEHKKLQCDANGNPLWLKSIEAVHEVYLGKCPTEFSYNGVKYTPMSFYNSLGLNPDDYISITSYTHHPFYEKFVLEIQDNWRWGQSYNLPLDEMMQVFDYAIDNGYTIAWGADVSEPGFRGNIKNGFCVLPDLEAKAQVGSDMAHWTGLTVTERNKESQTKPTPQRWVTQQERQSAYDNWETTDDHGMLIYGKATDQIGNEYYMVKNSWGKYGKYDGMFYVSKAYARYKTMNILVHKDAIPKDIKKKLGIK